MTEKYACGPLNGADCSTKVYPQAVIQSVRQQMKRLNDGTPSPEETLKVDDLLANFNLKDAALAEINIDSDNDNETVQEGKAMRCRQVLKKNSANYGTICYIVRRPGCFTCREQALSISILSSLYKHTTDGFGIIGIVKETIDETGLWEFHNDYFARFPLYCDKSYSFYHALGDRKMTFLPSLWTLLTHSFETSRLNMHEKKDIKWNGKGDGLVKGGLILFDQTGKARYCYKEETGEDLPLCDIVHALDTLRREQ